MVAVGPGLGRAHVPIRWPAGPDLYAAGCGRAGARPCTAAGPGPLAAPGLRLDQPWAIMITGP